MKYFFNYGTLILAIIEMLVFGLGLLVRYNAARRKIKPKKDADPYRNNVYVQAHMQMIKDEKMYKLRLATCNDDEEIEACKAKKHLFSQDVDEYYFSYGE